MTAPAQTQTAADRAIAYALAQVGKPYVWGGIGPNSYDCSGLTSQAYKSVGVTIPRTAAMQMRTGKAIPDVASALPGDLMFPYIDGSHVVMYLGNNQIVEAPTAGKNVQVVPVYKTAGGIRRIVDGGGTPIAAGLYGNNPPPGGGAAPGAASVLGQLVNVAKALSDTKTWASLGFIGLGVTLLGISGAGILKGKILS